MSLLTINRNNAVISSQIPQKALKIILHEVVYILLSWPLSSSDEMSSDIVLI